MGEERGGEERRSEIRDNGRESSGAAELRCFAARISLQECLAISWATNSEAFVGLLLPSRLFAALHGDNAAPERGRPSGRPPVNGIATRS
jgi:hypothetical protein